MRQARLVFASILTAAAFVLAACGGNPASSSGDGVVLRGTVVGASAVGASALSVGTAPATAEVVTVTVQENPAITTTVGADGSFTLRGLPEGGFHLVFSSGGVPLGTLFFTEVKPNQEITVTVQVTGSTVTLLEDRRNGIGHGDVEIEGRVDQVLTVNLAGDSKFVIDGRTVIARPGQTAIREGNRARSVKEVLAGQQVHVKGVWQAATTAAAQEVLAWEIKLQGGVDEPAQQPGRACMINGGRVGDGIQLEGRVASGGLPSFWMTVNGNRASGQVEILAGSAAVRCNGPSTTPAQCQARVTSGARIHVDGTLSTCSTTAASVAASEVKVQN
jgi:hypothetical protein